MALNKVLTFLCALAVVLGSCKVKYSFTGASISPEVKTVSVAYFQNYAALAEPTLSQTFTEDLRDIFLSQTNLDLVKNNGHLHFEGEIRYYGTAPTAITGNEQAAFTRLTITVNVRFINSQDDEQNFESNFTRYADYESSKNLNDVEDALIKEINEQLVQDIFNKALSNW